MDTLKALIVEDNVFMATILADMLLEHAQTVTVTGIAKSGKEALKLIANLKPNLVFLDVELPDMTGFELLDKLPEINFKTIFTTSHSHYAIKAFRYNALDYLVKPVKEEELEEAIHRMNGIETNKNDAGFNLKNHQNADNQKLSLPSQKGALHLVLNQITHFEGERNYTFIHLSSGAKVLSSKNLAYYENLLDDNIFFRCHRSFLVNREYIKSLNTDVFVLKSDLQIPISRRKKLLARNWFS